MIKIIYKEFIKGSHFNVTKKVAFFGVPIYSLEYSTMAREEHIKEKPKKHKKKENKIGFNYENKS